MFVRHRRLTRAGRIGEWIPQSPELLSGYRCL